jgi:UDP-glucose 4-epimerase
MKILVTGSNGFLGKSLLKILSSNQSVTTYALDLAHDDRFNNINYIEADISNLDSISNHFKDIDVVVHYASIADIHEASENSTKSITVNILGTDNILKLCVKNNIRRIIFSSSIYVYSNQGGIYKITKRTCEDLIKFYSEKYNLNYSILKLGSLYGPYGNHFNFIYNSLVSAYKYKKISRPGIGDELREYIHVDDVNNYVVKIFDDLNVDSEDVILSGYQKHRVSDILKMINEIMGGNIEINYLKDEKFEGHYKFSPYNFETKIPKKIILDSYVDLGNGIIECLNKIKNDENL